MLRPLIALALGILFGVGLAMSQMVNPSKVLAFLDVTGSWDPSLALVMAGALLFATPAFLWIRKLESPIFDHRFRLPTSTDVDRRLVAGGALFGIGWGLVGLCPGPALAAIALAPGEIVWFLLALVVGSATYRLVFPSPAEPSPTATATKA